MNRDELLEKVRALNLPHEHYIVIGSGLLGVLNLRTVRDIDIVIAPHLESQFSEDATWNREEKRDTRFYTRGVYDIATKLSWKDYPTTLEEAIETADSIEGIPFLNLEETIRFKRALGREKDIKDIGLLEKYREHGSI